MEQAELLDSLATPDPARAIPLACGLQDLPVGLALDHLLGLSSWRVASLRAHHGRRACALVRAPRPPDVSSRPYGADEAAYSSPALRGWDGGVSVRDPSGL